MGIVPNQFMPLTNRLLFHIINDRFLVIFALIQEDFSQLFSIY